MDLGATLRKAREGRALSWDQLGRATRIPKHLLVAMERNEWSKVPGGIFTRGYLRAYAHEVGLDGESLVAQYELDHPAPAPVAYEPGGQTGMRATPPGWPRWTWDPNWQKLTGAAVTIVAVLVLYVAVGRSPGGAENPQSPAAAGPAAAPAVAAPVQPVATLGAQPPPAVGTAAASGPRGDTVLAVPAADGAIALDLEVTRPCWVTLRVDGTRKVYRLVQPGDRERAEGREFVIRAGDAAAIQLSMNGEAARSLGRSGEVVTVRITRENLRAWLSARAGA